MPKKFNLKQEIASHNRTHKKQLSSDKTWGFDFLDPENLDILNQMSQLLEGNLEPPILIDQARAMQVRYKQGKAGLLLGERLAWEQKFLKYLSYPQAWDDWQKEVAAQNLSRKSRLQGLRNLWQVPLLHFHSNEALIRLSVFQAAGECQIKLAQKEFAKKAKRLPVTIAQNYKRFLTHLEERFTAAKEQVNHTMFMRLFAASESAAKTDQLFGDVLSYTADRLEEENVNLKRPTLSGHRHAFTPYTFGAFHQILEQKDIQLYKRKCDKLAWFKEEYACPTVTVKLNQQTCIVPKALEKQVPKWKGWPKWLFSDRHARADFIVEQQFAIAQLKIPLAEVPKIINSETQRVFLANLVEQEKRSQQALTALQSQKASRWQSGFKQMLEDWRNLHQERLHKCAVKRIAFLQAVSRQTPPENPMISLKQWRDLKPIIKPLETEVLPEHLKRSFSEIYNRLQIQCGQTPLLYAEGLFEQLADGKCLKLADRQYLLEILETIACGDDSLEDVINHEAVNLAAKNLLVILKLQLRQDNLNFKEIQVNGKLLTRIGDSQAQQELQIMLEKRVLRHFNLLVKLPEDKAKVHAERLESLVLQIGDSFLEERFKELQPLRVQNWSSYLAAYREMAEMFAVAYTDQRAELEAEKVEAYFTSQVKAVTADLAETEVLTALPQRLVSQQAKELTALPLAPYEKILTGLQGSNNRQGIKKAIEVTAASRLVVSQIKQAKSLAKKEKLLDELQTEITQRLPDLRFFQKRYRLMNTPTLSSEEKNYVVRATV